MKHTALVAVICSTLLITSSSAEDATDQPIDQSSPQSVAEGFVKAMKDRKWERAFRCLTLETQQYSAFMTMLPAGAVAGKDEAKNAALEELLMNHGLGIKHAAPEIQDMTDTSKLAAIFGDVMTWVAKNSSDDPEKQEYVLDRIAAGKHTDFMIDGDRATASFHPEYREKVGVRRFVKIDGKWFLEFGKSVRKNTTPKDEPEQ